MKRLLFLVAIVGFASFAFAQDTPETLLALVPSSPAQSCGTKTAQKTAFLSSLNDSISKMDAEIKRGNKETNTNVKQNEKKIEAKMGAQSGLSPTDVEKLKNMSPEERKAAVDKMMRDKYNVSLGDVQNLKNMTPEQRAAWAKGAGGSAMDKAQANPQQDKADIDKAKATVGRSKEVQDLYMKVSTRESEFRQQIYDLDNDPTAKAMLDTEIGPLAAKVSQFRVGGEGSSAALTKEEESSLQALRAAKLRYCQKFSPKYNTIMSNYLTFLKTSLPDYRRLEEDQAANDKALYGADKPVTEQGLGIKAIRNYAVLLKGIFKYDLIDEP